jgi:hypothetical protein
MGEQEMSNMDGIELLEDDDDFVRLMKRNGIALTRENYLDLIQGKDRTSEIGAELEAEIPSRFRNPDKAVSKILRKK